MKPTEKQTCQLNHICGVVVGITIYANSRQKHFISESVTITNKHNGFVLYRVAKRRRHEHIVIFRKEIE